MFADKLVYASLSVTSWGVWSKEPKNFEVHSLEIKWPLLWNIWQGGMVVGVMLSIRFENAHTQTQTRTHTSCWGLKKQLLPGLSGSLLSSLPHCLQAAWTSGHLHPIYKTTSRITASLVAALMGTFLLDCVNSTVSAFTICRKGFWCWCKSSAKARVGGTDDRHSHTRSIWWPLAAGSWPLSD